MDHDESAQFLSTLSKFIQSLCSNSVGFETSILIQGNLVLTVDDNQDFEFTLNDKICKSTYNQLSITNRSYHSSHIDSGAKKDSCVVTDIYDDKLTPNCSQISCPDQKELQVQDKRSTSILHVINAQTNVPYSKNNTKDYLNSEEYCLDEGATCDIKNEFDNYQDLDDDEHLGSLKTSFGDISLKNDLNNSCSHSTHHKSNERKKRKIVSMCNICNAKCIGIIAMRTHLRQHLRKNQPYSCSICAKRFFTEKSLQNHMDNNLHKGEKCFPCDECGRKFKSEVFLTKHKCTKEKKKPKSKPDVKKEVKRLLCYLCGHESRTYSGLHYHMLKHSGLKPHQCDVCQKSFVNRSELRKHQVIHTGERPFVCQLCGKCFARDNHLKGHLLSHSGLKPHTCDICGMAFTQKYNLRAHKRIHTGEKPYKCDTCGKSFTQYATRWVHKKTCKPVGTVANSSKNLNIVSVDVLECKLASDSLLYPEDKKLFHDY